MEQELVAAKLGMTMNFVLQAPLSTGIYKICTLLSTAFVDNPSGRLTPPAPQALSGAGSRGMRDAAFWRGTMTENPTAVRMQQDPLLFMNKI